MDDGDVRVPQREADLEALLLEQPDIVAHHRVAGRPHDLPDDHRDHLEQRDRAAEVVVVVDLVRKVVQRHAGHLLCYLVDEVLRHLLHIAKRHRVHHDARLGQRADEPHGLDDVPHAVRVHAHDDLARLGLVATTPPAEPAWCNDMRCVQPAWQVEKDPLRAAWGCRLRLALHGPRLRLTLPAHGPQVKRMYAHTPR